MIAVYRRLKDKIKSAISEYNDLSLYYFDEVRPKATVVVSKVGSQTMTPDSLLLASTGQYLLIKFIGTFSKLAHLFVPNRFDESFRSLVIGHHGPI